MKLSIGIFTYSTRPRGSVVHACALAEALTDAGHDVTLYALSKANDDWYRSLRCRSVLIPAEAAPADADALIAQRVEELRRGLRSLAPRHDVYHAEDCLAASGLLAAGALRPLVRTVHHVEHYDSAYLRQCQRRSVLEADGVLCVSKASQRDVLGEFGVRATVVPNGVELERFDARLASRERLVLSVGGVEPRKNSVGMLRAMSLVLDRVPDAHWVIVGGASIWEHAEYRARFAAELAALPDGIRARVHQLGTLSEEELATVYARSELMLHASVQEGFGLCVLEALAARVPVVVSRGEPFDEYLDESCASFVDPTSPSSIAAGVLDLLRDRPLMRARKSAGRVRAESFSWAAAARLHVAFYTSLVSATSERSLSHA
ncbi:MAG TPA: MSMEG_0565 family glycosyltransferase [Polyangiaceae bacterium]|nr:MSMEG_0565 family glycosyltransferase [Polyangiaceae bacterium]